MDYFNNSDIEPNKSIGPFYIGMEEPELFQMIPVNSPKRKIGDLYTIDYSSYKLFISYESRKIIQIGVTGEFSGKLLGKVGLGDTVQEIENSIGPMIVNDDLQLVHNEYPGVCLHIEPPLNDLNPEPNGSEVIDGIYVYRVE